MIMAIDDNSIPPPPSILTQVLRENLKQIRENVPSKEVLSLFDHFFEHGYLTRGDYHDVEDLDGDKIGRLLDLLVSKGDEKLLTVLIEYFKGKKKDGESASSSALSERLKLSWDKFSQRNPNDGQSSNKLGEREHEPTPGTGSIDSADFTLSVRALEEICMRFVIPNQKVKSQWATVIENMNGLKDLELLTEENEENEGEESRPKMRLRLRTEHLTLQNYIHCLNWNEIALKCLYLWRERNGINATFFSLIGVFQHSKLYFIGDKLLSQKEEIQKYNR